MLMRSKQQASITNAQEQVVNRTAFYVRQQLERDSSGHDWWHTYRVWQNAITIAENETGVLDPFVVQLAALLHDIGDWKMWGGDEMVGPRLAKEWLEEINVQERVISHVCQVISEISFKGAAVNSVPMTMEGMIVQDADRLDAIGAIGIARTFAYGGHKGRAIYEPAIKPEVHASFEEYKSNTSPTINHFYEKLLLLKDLMNTETARRVAIQRHAFIEYFLQKFFYEWNSADF